MKLIDILAREFKEWPEGVRTISQSASGELRDEANYFLHEKVTAYAEDGLYQNVTRAEWQAAVDALKADECAHSEANRLGCPECGADFRKPQYKAPAWTGEGLPPVGTVCECRSTMTGYDWKEVEILAHFKAPGAVAAFVPVHGYRQVSQAIAGCFRPIKTPEQIAAEEREKAIQEMCEHGVDAGDDTIYCTARSLYDAGYRKFEIVES